jgi:hypothetical protein
MDIVVAHPPNFKEITAKFEVGSRTIYAWGWTIFNPSGGRVSKDLIVHETVHATQQALMGGPQAWWRRYLDEPEFLLAQEAEAYNRQYRYICSQNLNHNYQFQVLQALALHLAGPMYGHVTTLDQAMELIRKKP